MRVGRTGLLRTSVAAMGAVVCALALTGCAGNHLAASTVGTPASATAVYPRDFVAIRTLMAARAKAVVDGDEKAFMATVDKTNSSFYDAQQVMYENLQALPVTSMSYEVGDSGLENAAGVQGGPLLSPEVVEHVDFANTDQRPVANEVDDTFAKRSGHWLLAADATDTSETSGDTARPWAGPKISVVTKGHLIVVADASTAGAVQQLATTVEQDLSFDAGILEVPVNDHLMVDATTAGSVTKFDNNEPAGAVTFGVSASKNFQDTGFAGYRVKVNPTEIPYLNREPVLLRHELTHYLMFKYTGLNPKWLTEGLAEYVSHQPAGLPSEYITATAYARLMARPQDLILSGLFGQDPDTDYPLAMACVTFLVNNGGITKVETLMKDYASYNDAPYEDEHTGQVLQKVYGMTASDVAHGAFALLAALR